MPAAIPTYGDLANPSIHHQPIYEPGRPIDVVAREFGLDPDGVIKLASNENPLGPSPKAVAAARDFLDRAHLYPDGGCYLLREKLAQKMDLSADQFVFGNGSNEVIELVGHTFLMPGDEVVMGEKAFIVYKLVSLLFGATPVEVPLRDFTHDLAAMREAVTEKTKLVFLASPNNPTGTINEPAEVIDFARSLPHHVIFGLDEAYCEYLDNPVDLRPLIAEGRKVIGFRTFSKIYGLAGFRLGYGYCGADCASLLNRAREPFNVNSLAQTAAVAALDDSRFVERSREVNRTGMRELSDFCKQFKLDYVPSHGNFMLVKVGNGLEVFRKLQRVGVIVRPMGPYGLPEYARISVGRKAENARLCQELDNVLGLS